MLSGDIQAITLRGFLDHLDAIPEEKWGSDSLSPDQACVMAILGVSIGSPPDAGLLAKRLLEVTGDIEFVRYWELINKKYPMSGLEMYRSIPRVVRVNRGEDKGYQQPTPKQRVLSYLRSVEAEIEKLENL